MHSCRPSRKDADVTPCSVTLVGAGILESTRLRRTEFPPVEAVLEGKHQDAPGRAVDFTVWPRSSDGSQRRTAGANDELPDASCRIEPAVEVLRCEAFVVVIVCGDHDIHAEFVFNAGKDVFSRCAGCCHCSLLSGSHTTKLPRCRTMALPSADQSLLRRYLLGTVTPESREDLSARAASRDRTQSSDQTRPANRAGPGCGGRSCLRPGRLLLPRCSSWSFRYLDSHPAQATQSLVATSWPSH